MTDAKHLTQELRGHWFGDYGLAYCPAHENTNTPALSIKNANDGTLLAYCHAGCNFADVRAALRDRGLLAGGNGQSASKRWMPTYRGAPSADQRVKEANNAKFAAALWQDAQPICDSYAERYLRRRDITCPLPPTLRFAPACKHPTGSRVPTMIARVDYAASFAVHRTFLADQGAGKTDRQPTKAMLGSCRGGVQSICQLSPPMKRAAPWS